MAPKKAVKSAPVVAKVSSPASKNAKVEATVGGHACDNVGSIEACKS